jgi:PadR family transcriptional regulator, regulatory protein PadR
MTPLAEMMLRALTASPGREMYGLEIMRAASLPSGTVYPLLARLEAAGWVAARDEDITPQDEGRPVRRYYRATAAGVAAVKEAAGQEAERLTALGVTADTPGPAA